MNTNTTLKLVLGMAVAGLFLSGCATTSAVPDEERELTATEKAVKEAERDPSKLVFTEEELRRTGGVDLADALRKSHVIFR